jgi:hypothetical protein
MRLARWIRTIVLLCAAALCAMAEDHGHHLVVVTWSNELAKSLVFCNAAPPARVSYSHSFSRDLPILIPAGNSCYGSAPTMLWNRNRDVHIS